MGGIHFSLGLNKVLEYNIRYRYRWINTTCKQHHWFDLLTCNKENGEVEDDFEQAVETLFQMATAHHSCEQTFLFKRRHSFASVRVLRVILILVVNCF